MKFIHYLVHQSFIIIFIFVRIFESNTVYWISIYWKIRTYKSQKRCRRSNTFGLTIFILFSVMCLFSFSSYIFIFMVFVIIMIICCSVKLYGASHFPHLFFSAYVCVLACNDFDIRNDSLAK